MPFFFIVVRNATGEAVHEDGHGRDREAAKGADLAGLGHASGQVTSQECGLVGREDLAGTLGMTRVIGIVNDGELLGGVGCRGSRGGISQQEANR